ncbi:MAG: glycosyltransferase family 39 protein [Planctomycetaceae bacterium]|nr:glycosyltransferase family 39 protein [Planctomycetaceae bacterium]
MDDVDDTQLVLMARKPAAEMFPLLRRTSALSPLLMLICVLPPLAALQMRNQTEADALWGLRAIELKSVPVQTQIISPPREGAAGALRSQPPLGTWLTIALLRLTNADTTLALIAVSYAATAASVFMFVQVLRVAVSEKAAFWGAILGGFQGSLLVLAGRCGPSSLGVFFALTAMWGFLGHIERGSRRHWLKLVGGGASLGACILSGGPLATGILVILLLYVLGLRGQSLSRKQWSGPKPIAVWAGWPALKSLGLLTLIGVLVGGWWPTLRHRDEPNFLANWPLGVAEATVNDLPSTTIDATSSDGSAFVRVLPLLGPMLALTLFGIVRSSLAAAISQNERRRRGQMLLLAWILVSGAAWWSLTGQPNASPFVIGLWEALLSLGLAGVGAVCLDDIATRRISMPLAVSVSVAGVIVLVSAGWAERVPEIIREGGWLLGVIAAAGAGVAIWKLLDSASDRDVRHRIVLGALIVAHVGTAAAFGLRSTRVTTEDDQALATFTRQLPAGRNVTDIILLGHPSRIPLRIRLAVRASCPNAVEHFADSWETALSLALDAPPDAPRTLLAVDWQSRESRAATLQASGLQVTPSPSLQFFEGVPLRAFMVRRVIAQSADFNPSVGGLATAE